MFHEQTRMLPYAFDYIIVAIRGELEYAQCNKFQLSMLPEETSMLFTRLTIKRYYKETMTKRETRSPGYNNLARCGVS
jgi:hypothetical protein